MPEMRKLQQRLRRIEGQVKGLQRMIAEGRECDDILTQILAVKAALDRITTDQVELQMMACLRDLSPAEAHAKMTRTLRLISKM